MMAEPIRSIALSAFFVAVLCGICDAQFTQGPPGNPSAAGITTGNPPPVPVPPHVVGTSPPPVVERQTMIVADGRSDGITSPRSLLSPYGIVSLIDGVGSAAVARQLDLSADQIQRLDAVRSDYYRKTRDLRYEVMQRRLELRKLFLDRETDPALIRQKRQEAASLWNRLTDNAVQGAIEARNILNGEQLERLERLTASDTYQ